MLNTAKPDSKKEPGWHNVDFLKVISLPETFRDLQLHAIFCSYCIQYRRCLLPCLGVIRKRIEDDIQLHYMQMSHCPSHCHEPS